MSHDPSMVVIPSLSEESGRAGGARCNFPRPHAARSFADASNDTEGVIARYKVGVEKKAWRRLGQSAQPAVPASNDTEGVVARSKVGVENKAWRRLGQSTQPAVPARDDGSTRS